MAYPMTNTPGVQIDEVQLGAPPIFGVGTSTAGFVGVAPKPDSTVVPGKPTPVTNEDEFKARFADKAAKSTELSRAVLGFFRNGGRLCYIVHVASATPPNLIAGLKELELVDDVAILAVPGATDRFVTKEMQDQAERTRDRFAILDPPPRVTNLGELATGGAKRPANSRYSAFYYPRILVGPEFPEDPRDGQLIAPSGCVAGVYAHVDSTRGVHKAPANERIRGAVALEHALTDADQDMLNNENVNLIRTFDGDVTIWGARTLVPKDPTGQDAEYRYVSTRRLVSFIEESLERGLRFAVFEPNNIPLRQKVSRAIQAFLDGLWRDGALFGATAAESYYVRFPPMFDRDVDRKKGLLVVEIGLRVSYPAEFIIIRIGPLDDAPNAA